MLANKENIKNFIPQREPFIMIDELHSADEKGFKSCFEVIDSNIFLDTELSESALTENIAQTCAAGFGYLGSLEEEGEPKIGFIGAITKLKVHSLPKLGAKLSTEVEILNTFGNIHLIQGSVLENGTKLLDCQMKIVLA
tara:strand:- start:16876 stop:17292 length:417 start_codon:yes stop_codon:yes gene_type:complete